MRSLSVFVLSVLLAGPAFGQSVYESQIHDYGFGWTNDAAALDQYVKERNMRAQGEIIPDKVVMYLEREPYMDDGDQFALKFVVPESVTGCIDYSPIEYEANFVDPYYLNIDIKHYEEIKVSSDAPHLDCPRTYRRPEAVIPLSRKDLQARGTKQFKINGKNFRKVLNVAFEDNKVILREQPGLLGVGLIQGREIKIDHYEMDFDDAKRLALFVPMSRDGEDLYDQLVNFAGMQGLIVEDKTLIGDPAWEGIKSTKPDRSYIIVMDRDGRLTSQFTDKEMREVGQISVLRPVQTPNGVRDANIPLTVFAKPL